MKLVELALIKAGVSHNEPETSEINPGATIIASFMNDARVFANIFTCPSPSQCGFAPITNITLAASYTDKIVGYGQGKNLDGAPHPASSISGETVTHIPALGYGWWGVRKAGGVEYLYYGPSGWAMGHAMISSINSTTMMNSAGVTGQAHSIMVLLGAILVCMWNQNLKAAGYLIDQLEERLKFALQPIDMYGSMRVPQNGVLPDGVQQK